LYSRILEPIQILSSELLTEYVLYCSSSSHCKMFWLITIDGFLAIQTIHSLEESMKE
jgi:hypothetical protein